jgi:hypothetical protein
MVGLDPDESGDASPTHALVDALDRLDTGDGVPRDELLKEAGRQGFKKPELVDRLDDLKRRGEVYVVEDRVKLTSNPG